MTHDKRPAKPLWAQLRDTHGRDLASSVPLSALLAAHPALRSKGAPELAEALGLSVAEAESAIVGYVRDAVPLELRAHAPGSSVDRLLTLAGRPAPPGWVRGAGLRSRVERSEAGSAIGDFSGTRPLSLGFFYKLPFRGVMGSDAQGYPAPVSVDPPTAYDALVATILRSEVPPDPNDPGLPHPDYLRAFCVAMGGSCMTGTNPGGGMLPLPFHPGAIDPSLLRESARGVVEDVGSWPRLQPGEAIYDAATRKAYEAFRWYGVLSGDTEGPPGAWGWSDSDRVSRMRYVFWYQQDPGDYAWNKCVQVQGFSEAQQAWILPSKSGEAVWVWYWRPTDSQFVGEWRQFFNFDRWNVENKGEYMAVAVWVAAAALTVATLGAGAGALAAAGTFQAAIYATERLYKAIGKGEPAAAVAAAVELGDALNKASDKGDFLGAMKAGNPGLAKFAEGVAAPFQKVWDAAGGVAATVQSVWTKAEDLRKQIPKVDGSAWAAAASAFGLNSGAATWLQLARLPSSAEVAGQLWENAPAWARDVVAMGVALSAAEQAQAADAFARSSMVFGPQGGGGGGGGMMLLQRPAPVVESVMLGPTKRAWTAVPSPAVEPGALTLAPGSSGSSAGAALPLLAVAAAAAYFLIPRK